MITTTTTTTYKCDQCGKETDDYLSYPGWIILNSASSVQANINIINGGVKKTGSYSRLDFDKPECMTAYFEDIRVGQ